MAHVPIVGLRTHGQKVCSAYKRAVRTLQAYYTDRGKFRYHAVLMRAKFDEHKDEKDLIKATELLKNAERELFLQQHPAPLKFPGSPGGVAFEREVPPPDWILDYWHPLEKAQYPEYFKRREQRKKEYVIWWEKQYGKSTEEDKH